MDRDREVYSHSQEHPQQPSISVADELMKLASLKEKGVISEDEFQQMKQDLPPERANSAYISITRDFKGRNMN